MAEAVTNELRGRPPSAFHGGTFDARSLVLATAITMFLLWLLASIGAMPGDKTDPIELLAVFEVPADEQEEVPPQPDGVDQPAEKPIVDGATSPPAPGPAPALAPMIGALDLAAVPIPAIELSPVTVPEFTLSGTATVLADGAGSQSFGNGIVGGTGTAAGTGTSGEGEGGAGSGGDGTRSRLFARWAPEMRMSQLNAFFPEAARPTRQGGQAWVKCFVLEDHRVRDCTLIEEFPVGLGFGAAAVASEPVMRVQVRNRQGKRVFNTWVLYLAEFRHPETGSWAPKK